MKSFNCEICKTPYPLRFRSENNCFDIIDYVRPIDKNYIILESLNQLKDNNNYKSIQVITLEENEKIVMGRGHETDVRINDISVSRTHALITLIGNKIFIKDLKSKFGTLVLVQDDLEITEKTITLQIGRTYGEFCVISSKEYQKLIKEPVKVEDKSGLGNKNKQLFQVEKPDKKESKNRPSNFNLNGMDVDNDNNNNNNNNGEHENMHLSNMLASQASQNSHLSANGIGSTLNNLNLFTSGHISDYMMNQIKNLGGSNRSNNNNSSNSEGKNK